MSLNFKLIGDRELAMYLGNVQKNIKPQVIAGLNQIGTHLKKKAKSKFGNYQHSWPKLKRASVLAKYRRRALKGIKTKGVKSFSIGPDEPLILFGDLKNSIQKEIHSGSLETEVYSDNVYAAVHEYGYKHVPARSFLRLTLSEEASEVVDMMEKRIGKII